MKEATLLGAVDRIVRRIQIEHDLAWRHAMCVEEQVDEQPLDQGPVVTDLVVARGRARWRVLETIEGRLAGQRRAAGSAGAELAGDGGQHRVVAQGVVVDQILVAQGQREHTLPDQGLQRVLDLLGRALVDKAGREPPDQADRPVGGAQ